MAKKTTTSGFDEIPLVSCEDCVFFEPTDRKSTMWCNKVKMGGIIRPKKCVHKIKSQIK